MRGLQVSGSGNQVKVDVLKHSSHKAPSPEGGSHFLVAFPIITFCGAVFQWHRNVSEPDSSLPSQTVFLGGHGGKRIFWTFVSITWVLPQWTIFHWVEDVLLIVYVQLVPFEKTSGGKKFSSLFNYAAFHILKCIPCQTLFSKNQLILTH